MSTELRRNIMDMQDGKLNLEAMRAEYKTSEERKKRFEWIPPEKRASVPQSPEIDATEIFVRRKAGNQTRILMGMRDPGEAAALMPVLERIKDQPVDIFMWAKGKAKEKFQAAATNLGFKLRETADPLSNISAFRGDLVIAGVSMSPDIEMALTKTGKKDGTVVCWVSDYVMGSVFQRNRDMVKTDQSILPDFLFVASDWVKQKELENLPKGFDPQRIIVTGQPAFDRLAKEDKEGTRKRVRKELGISDNEKLITYIGAVERKGIDEISRGSLEVLVDGLVKAGLKDFKLVVRRHPRDAATMDEYLKIAEPVGEKIVDTTGKTTDDIILASDLVVNTISTAGMESVYRGIPVVHVWIKDLIRKSELGDTAQLPPIVDDGTSPAILEKDQAAEILKKLLTDEDYTKELQQKMTKWKVDGHAAERIANFILELL